MPLVLQIVRCYISGEAAGGNVKLIPPGSERVNCLVFLCEAVFAK